MRHFRRSTKSSDKSDGKPNNHHISIPQKDAIAIVPPKKVIKALYDYNVQPGQQGPGYLNFTKGDFLHVVGRENDPDWFEACNPMIGSRGLVPVSYFEIVGKQARGSTGFEPGHARNPSSQQHDSGYAEKSELINENGRPRTSRQMGKAGAMVYGIVQYDFHAERPDELEAKAGEAIIVIAQSNPEWFVAKPITRLGGPGLIPVSFIQIHDMGSGQPVNDGSDAVRRAGVPKVEEWKKMAAEYKNSSIPLGKFDSGSISNGLSQSMDRLSMNSKGSGSYNQGSYNQGSADPRSSQQHLRTGTPTQQYQAPNMSIRHSQMVPPVRAKVPSYRTVNEEFMFVVEAVTEDGKCWELQRHYKDFYGLQLLLIEQFPSEAGKIQGHQRQIPYMPGPLPWVTERLTQERRGHLDKYLKDLLEINRDITTSHPVCAFFTPKEGDREISPGADFDVARYSQGSHHSSMIGDSNNSSSANLQYGGGAGYTSPQKQHQQQQRAPSSGPHLRSPSDLRQMNGNGPPPMNRNNSALTNASATSLGTGYGSVASTGSNPHASSGPMKIKAWFGEKSCVMLRLPQSFSYDDLMQKIRERWSLEMNISRHEIEESDIEFDIQYRDEHTNQYRNISNDDDVSEAKERCEKLTLWVSSSQAV